MKPFCCCGEEEDCAKPNGQRDIAAEDPLDAPVPGFISLSRLGYNNHRCCHLCLFFAGRQPGDRQRRKRE